MSTNRARVSDVTKRRLVQVALRDETSARIILQAAESAGLNWGSLVNVFGGAGTGVLYLISQSLADTGEMPIQEFVEVELVELANQQPDIMIDLDVEPAVELVKGAWSSKNFDNISEVVRNWVRKFTKLVFEESVTDELSDKVSVAATTMVVSDFASLMELTRLKLDSLEGATSAASSINIFSSEDILADRIATPAVTTGIHALDIITGGGGRTGDANVVAGPQGSCKTVVAISACASQAMSAYRAGLKGHRSIYVSYEMQKTDVVNRLLCFTARIPLGRIRELTSINQLAGPRDPRPDYEIARNFQGPSEKERLDNALVILREHFQFYDFTGRDPKLGNCGSGGVGELISALKNRFNTEKVTPTSIWIDHVNGMCDRWISPPSVRDREHGVREMMRQMPQRLAQLATQFNTSAWVVAQMTGVAQGFAPTAKMTQADLADCKSLGMYASNVVFFTKPQAEPPRYLRARSDKARHGTDIQDAVCSLDGEMQTLHHCPTLRVHEPTRSFVETEAQRVTRQTGAARPATTQSQASPFAVGRTGLPG